MDRRFHFLDDGDRQKYLNFIGQSACKIDWRFLNFALMSNHVHWGLLTGRQPLYRAFHTVHTRFAGYWHGRYGGLGPVFADRPANYHVRPQRFAELVAYNHMDPVRQGLVTRPTDSRWTSHRFYLRLERPPPWLHVELGLDLCGFEDTEGGRKLFDEFVQSSERLHWQSDLGELYEKDGSVELGGMIECGVNETVDEVLHAAAAIMGVSPMEMRSYSRRNQVCAARRLVVSYASQQLRLTPSEIGEQLSVTRQSVWRMLQAKVDRRLTASLKKALATSLRR